MSDWGPPATKDSPDFSTCRNCGVAIGWDDYSYTHLDTGFVECGLTISGGEQPPGWLSRMLKRGITATLNPEITQTTDPKLAGKRAGPVEWDAKSLEKETKQAHDALVNQFFPEREKE